MKKYDYLIVGAGLFGATFASLATAAGKKCLVVDKLEHIGGSVYDEKEDDYYVSKYGAHIFHTNDKKVWDYVNRFTEFNSYEHRVVASVGENVYPLPFNMYSLIPFHGNLPPEKIEKMLNKCSAESKNMEEEAIRLVGKRMYNELIKGYTEKQWGEKCENLPASLIARLPLRYTFDTRYFNDTYQGMPKKGYTEMIKRMLLGTVIKLGYDYQKEDPLQQICEKIVFTGQLESLYNSRFGDLTYRSLQFNEGKWDGRNFQGAAVINYPSKEVPYTRVIEHKFLYPSKSSKSVVTYETPCDYEKGKNIAYYPIDNATNRGKYQLYKEEASKNKTLLIGGRLASYKYMNMDQVVKQAIELWEKE